MWFVSFSSSDGILIMLTVTKRSIKLSNPCLIGWERFDKYYSDFSHTKQIPLFDTLKSNPFLDSIWAIKAVDGLDNRRVLFFCSRLVKLAIPIFADDCHPIMGKIANYFERMSHGWRDENIKKVDNFSTFIEEKSGEICNFFEEPEKEYECMGLIMNSVFCFLDAYTIVDLEGPFCIASQMFDDLAYSKKSLVKLRGVFKREFKEFCFENGVYSPEWKEEAV